MVAGLQVNLSKITVGALEMGGKLVEQQLPSRDDLATEEFIKETYEKVEVEKR